MGWFITVIGFRLLASDLPERFELDVGMEGRRGSGPKLPCEPFAIFEDGAITEVVADAKGAANVFFTFESIEDTIAYDDWSFSSSSAKGLVDVRLVTSSNFELLRDLVEAVLLGIGRGVIDFGESIARGSVVKFVSSDQSMRGVSEVETVA